MPAKQRPPGRHKPKAKNAKSSATNLAPWRRLTVDVSASVADAVSGALLDDGALGLETEDDETRAVPGRALAPTGRAIITATFSRAPGLEARTVGTLKRLAEHLPDAADVDVTWTNLWPEDWNAIFRQQWAPFRCGARVWVCPSWERDTFRAERVGEGDAPIVIYMDAGMAFGTGTHETTQLCVAALEEHAAAAAATRAHDASGAASGAPRMQRMQRVLDVGTGTGILSIAALHLGAASARGTDIDPVAVQTARDNAKGNGVLDRFVADANAPDATGPCDTVIANILAGTLIELADVIARSVAVGGRLFLSGVLVDQERAVRDAYIARGLAHTGTASKNGWVRIDLAR